MPEPANPLPLIYLVDVMIAPFVLGIAARSKRRPLPLLRLALLSIGLCLSVHLAVIAQYDMALDRHLESFDLNGDGVFSGAELNADQERAVRRVTSGLSRDLAFIWALSIATLSSIAVFGAAALSRRMARGAARAA